eukprot:COSAG04_NODE_19683_length_410_cov_0.996785_1_plen_112_part_10
MGPLRCNEAGSNNKRRPPKRRRALAPHIDLFFRLLQFKQKHQLSGSAIAGARLRNPELRRAQPYRDYHEVDRDLQALKRDFEAWYQLNLKREREAVAERDKFEKLRIASLYV